MWRRLTVVCFCALLLAASAASGATKHYKANVSGAVTGPGHSFVVGDGLNLVFRDLLHSHVRYMVCWSRGHGSHCWHRTTGAAGHASRVFTAAPEHVGRYTTTWYVHGKRVARWKFYNGLGD